MFNVTVTSDQYDQLKQTLKRKGIKCTIEQTYRDGKTKYVDVSVGGESQRFSPKLYQWCSSQCA